MDNKYTGEVELIIKGEKFVFQYDWAALAALRSSFTEDQINLIVQGGDMQALADVMAIGLKSNHPDITAEDVARLSPPLMPAINAVEKALRYAYFGPDAAPERTEDDAPKADGPKPQKKTTKRRKTK